MTQALKLLNILHLNMGFELARQLLLLVHKNREKSEIRSEHFPRIRCFERWIKIRKIVRK